MQKVEMYKADDGSVFETEKECKNYESKQWLMGKLNEDIHLWDADAEEIIEWVIENIKYIKELK